MTPNLLATYGSLYNVIRSAFRKHHPFSTNEKPYQPLIGAILSEWQEPNSIDALYMSLCQEVGQWLGPGYVNSNAESAARLRQAAAAVYSKLHTVQDSQQGSDKEQATNQITNREYATLYYQALKIIPRQDPIGIGFLPDEYTPEVETILPRLGEANSHEELFHIVEEEFRKWFGEIDKQPAAEQKYKEISRQIWLLWQRSKLGSDLDKYLVAA